MGQVVRTSLVVPESSLSCDMRYQVYDQSRMLAEHWANQDNNLVDFPLSIRPLNGDDFGLTGHGWTEQVSATVGTGNTYESSAISATLAIDRLVVIYGVYVASSLDSVSGLRFTVGGARTHQWDLQSVLSNDPFNARREDRTLLVFPPPGAWIDPVMVPSNTQILIEHYVRGSSTSGIQSTELVFLGVVAERISGGGAGLYGGN